MNIGFSTGSLALGDFRTAISMLKGKDVNAIELSALREEELGDLINSIDTLKLGQFKHISFHAPSKLISLSEEELIGSLLPIAQRGWAIIVHPDIIQKPSKWRVLGECLCIENMDKRKPIGRTAENLERIFDSLPNASFCLDLAHARQVDPTMMEAYLMLKKFGHRLSQLHVSDVNSQSLHESLNVDALFAYKRISKFIPKDIPVIIESPVTEDKIKLEIVLASYILDDFKFIDFLKRSTLDFHPFTAYESYGEEVYAS